MHRLAINYQFDPTQLHELPHWTFRFRFRVPGVIFRPDVSKVAGALRRLELDVVHLQPAEHRHFTLQGREFSFRIHVDEEVRRSPDGQERYEKDFWRIVRRMYDLGFREATYEPETEAVSR